MAFKGIRFARHRSLVAVVAAAASTYGTGHEHHSEQVSVERSDPEFVIE